MSYDAFIRAKLSTVGSSGFDPPPLHSDLFDFQRDVVRWALRRGRAAVFADCGLGKTLMQVEWSRRVVDHTSGKVLILAPLAVAAQTVKEAARFGIQVKYCRAQKEVSPGITIANYEMLNHFDASMFDGVVLDESSILKSYDGSTRTEIVEAFAETPFRLACTATPAPNDLMEMGNHAEFLGVCSRVEMLATYFVHDGGDTSKWRLKGHAEREYWRWITDWAVMIRRPSDLGYSDDRFSLPALKMHQLKVDAKHQTVADAGLLFQLEARTLVERRDARRASIADRVRVVAEMVNRSDEPWLVWCDLNAEGDRLESLISGSVQVAGSDTREDKESRMLGFAAGQHRVLITKPSVAGFGMNWQHCRNVAFVGVSDSYEQFYQALRRCWRFGQRNEVNCWVVTSSLEGAVLKNLERKEAEAQQLATEMVANMADLNRKHLSGTVKQENEYRTDMRTGDRWTMHLGDCVEKMKEIPDESIGYSVFSPPFASLYTYSNSTRDMGNCKSHGGFFEHFQFLVPELLRVTKPGRLLSFHCMQLPLSKQNDGVIGLRDFRGMLIKAFQDAGWVYHSEVVIWKDPVTAMQRTKAIGLLYKQLRKDSALSRQGIPDYLVTMRKPGVNPDPIAHTPEDFPVDHWQRYASPVWMDINPSNTLQYRSAREAKDERHICPLQLEVIERAVRLWSDPKDTVLSPFAGIGSEGFVARQMGRGFIGVELKESYYRQACKNLATASETETGQLGMFSRETEQECEPEVTDSLGDSHRSPGVAE